MAEVQLFRRKRQCAGGRGRWNAARDRSGWSRWRPRRSGFRAQCPRERCCIHRRRRGCFRSWSLRRSRLERLRARSLARSQGWQEDRRRGVGRERERRACRRGEPARYAPVPAHRLPVQVPEPVRSYGPKTGAPVVGSSAVADRRSGSRAGWSWRLSNTSGDNRRAEASTASDVR